MSDDQTMRCFRDSHFLEAGHKCLRLPSRSPSECEFIRAGAMLIALDWQVPVLVEMLKPHEEPERSS
jgi:hypothetical protein